MVDDVVVGLRDAGSVAGTQHRAALRAARRTSGRGAGARPSTASARRACRRSRCGAQAIMSGMAESVIAGGVEMMSQVPMSGYHTRLDPERARVVHRHGLHRRARRRALEGDARGPGRVGARAASRRRRRPWQAARSTDQIVPVPVERVSWNGTEKKVETARVRARRAGARRHDAPRGSPSCKPAFKANGTVTAGNASPYSDGAAALVLMRRDKADGAGPRAARALRHASPWPASSRTSWASGRSRRCRRRCAKAGMSLADIDLIEFNEAFAAQVLAVDARPRHAGRTAST